jgi:hypothetical protein
MSEIKPAKPQLIDLAREMRPSWDAGALDLALDAAHRAGWTWEATFRYVTGLLLKPDAEPRDLTMACRGPLGRPAEPDADPDLVAALVDERLAALGTSRAEMSGGAA